MNGENAVATPKAAESVNSLSIAGRDEIFLATKIVLRFVTLVVTPARWLGGRVYQKPELLQQSAGLCPFWRHILLFANPMVAGPAC